MKSKLYSYVFSISPWSQGRKKGGTFDISIGEGKGGGEGREWLRHTLMGGRRKREVVPPEPTLEKQEEWHLG